MARSTEEPVAVPADAGASVLQSTSAPPGKSRPPGERRWIAGIFIGPAAIWLGAIVLYPLVYTLIRSLFSDTPTGAPGHFAGVQNYIKIGSQSDSLEALKNNIIWVIVVPALVTILGLMFAVLTEHIRWASAFKVALFMPMAISFLASGVTWSLIYVDQPSEGLGNAVVTGIHDIFSTSVTYPNVHTVNPKVLAGNDNAGFTSAHSFSTGTPALLPMVGLSLSSPPANAVQAAKPAAGTGLAGTVWNDFALGGGGHQGAIDHGELGIPGLQVQALQNGKTVGTATTGADGSFRFPSLTSGSYTLRLPASDFTAAYGGVSWLGKNLITPAIIVVYLWIYAGFAMVLLAAGMSAISRDALEAARMDGATEWQVFRHVTAPLLAPVLMVVFVTMVINVLKVFDIVFVIQQAAGGNARYANVLAVQLYSEYGNQQFGAASAIGIALVILVIPAMIFQVHRFRKEAQ
ncbi:MAG TPA: ABC transporter permease subunit [Nocardioidaceae bacterium]|nr:ABC transporter permease subunit [Nocardioidaceae bacterium]